MGLTMNGVIVIKTCLADLSKQTWRAKIWVIYSYRPRICHNLI